LFFIKSFLASPIPGSVVLFAKTISPQIDGGFGSGTEELTLTDSVTLPMLGPIYEQGY
jgi:hypothetical protein